MWSTGVDMDSECESTRVRRCESTRRRACVRAGAEPTYFRTFVLSYFSSFENGPGALQVVPHGAHPARVAEQRGGVVRRHQRRPAVRVDLSAQLSDAQVAAQQR